MPRMGDSYGIPGSCQLWWGELQERDCNSGCHGRVQRVKGKGHRAHITAHALPGNRTNPRAKRNFSVAKKPFRCIPEKRARKIWSGDELGNK